MSCLQINSGANLIIYNISIEEIKYVTYFVFTFYIEINIDHE